MSITKEQILENLDSVKQMIKEIDFTPKKEEEIKYLEIKNRWTGSIIYKSKKTTWKEAVEEAIENKANLSECDLSLANLSEADLSEEDLSLANLSGADLSKADLSKANLSEANLSGADLSKANLSWANLNEANLNEANLSEANLNGCIYYMGAGNKNFEALCKAIKTIRHQDGKFEDLVR